jgi:membrane protein required for beta-lactamase induction
MTFFIIALSLLAEHFLLEQEEYRQPDWFRRYTLWSQQLPWGEWMSQSVTGIILILAPLLLAVVLLQTMFNDILGGMPELLFATLVLFFCLGPRDLRHQVQGFIDAWDTGEEEKAKRIGSEFIPNPSLQTEAHYGLAVASGILKQAYVRTFSVLFWFVILGPLGAVLYRSCHTLKQTLPSLDNLGVDFGSGVDHLLQILDWIPARLTAFTYALSGNFPAATHDWWDTNETDDNTDRSAEDILDLAGSGALGLDSALNEDDEELNPAVTSDMAMAMVLRSLTIWLGLLALITITSWLS